MKLLFSDNSLRELLNFRGEVIEHFINRGDEVYIVAPDNIENLHEKYPYVAHAEIKFLNFDPVGANPLKDIRYLLSLYKIYKDIKPDYIFHYTIKPNIYGTLAARMLNIKSCAMIAGLGKCFSDSSLGNKIARLLYRFSLKFVDKVLVLNQTNYDYLLKNKYVSEDKLILLPGGEGINLTKFH